MFAARNVLLTRERVSAPPAFDAMGAGWATSVASNTTFSWSHTATAGAAVFVDISMGGNGTISSVTYGGVSMTLTGNQGNGGNGTFGNLFRYQLNGAPGGAQTVFVTFSGNQWISANSISFVNVTTIGAAALVSGLNSPSQSVTCSAGQMIVQAFAATQATVNSPSGGTNRYLQTSSLAVLHMNTATASTTFTASGAGSWWSGIANVLT